MLRKSSVDEIRHLAGTQTITAFISHEKLDIKLIMSNQERGFVLAGVEIVEGGAKLRFVPAEGIEKYVIQVPVKPK